VEPRVAEKVLFYLTEEFGNAGSRTHSSGLRAKKAVSEARAHVAAVVGSDPSEVVFTSGATESNNLALLGLSEALRESGRTHILSTAIEHKAVLEPLEVLAENGFDVELLSPGSAGRISVDELGARLRTDTGLVTVMQVNNETGVRQPTQEIAERLADHEAFFHVDAAQGFGKVDGLEHERVDLISVSGHKVYGPKGIGALIARRRRLNRPPLRPLMVGGGQERGLRPGTLPVPLIVGLGEAAAIARRDRLARIARVEAVRHQILGCFSELSFDINGATEHLVPWTLNVALDGVDAEAAIVALKDVVELSNGAACTSSSYTTSHVLAAMGADVDRARSSLRLSWCHMTPDVPVREVRSALALLAP